MAPPKKQKREYTAGEYVWVKIKGYPIWPGQVEDVKNVKNDDVIKKKRKNAVLIKFLDDTYTWAVHEDIKPLEKETLEDYIISPNHKTFKQWKDAFEKCCKLAGIDDSVVEASLNSSKDNKNKKKRERDENDKKDDEENPKKKKKTRSVSPAKRKSSTSPSPKRTARKASLGAAEKKKKTTSPSPKKKKETPKTPKKTSDVKKNTLNPPLLGNTTLLSEFASLLTKYQKEEETQKVYQLLKVIANFYVTDIQILHDARIGKIINKLSNSKDPKIKSLATKIYNYYDSLILESVNNKDKKKKEEEEKGEEKKEEEKKEEEKKEGEEVKKEENNEEKGEEKKEDTDITISEAPKSEPGAEKTEVKGDDKMETEPVTSETEAKPSESQESNSSIIEPSQ